MWFPGKQWGHPFYDAYRLIDIENGTDLTTVNIPRDWEKMKAGKYYSDKAACKYIMNHTDPDKDNNKKFLLSFTKNLETARVILNWKKKKNFIAVLVAVVAVVLVFFFVSRENVAT